MGRLPFVDPALAYRIEIASAWRGVRYAEAYQTLHPEASCATMQVGGGWAVFTAPASPVNRVSGLGLTGPVSSADFDQVEAFFTDRGVQPKIHACPLADESLFDLLLARGYQVRGFFSVLARQIDPDFRPGPLPDGMQVALARPEDAGLWLKASAQGFEEMDEPPQETFDILGPNFHAQDGLPYLAWLDGQPAGAGGMYYNLTHRVYELGGASTRPQFRRRGVQHALIEARMAAALALGCDLAVVNTEPGSRSQRNLQRAGFELAYTLPVFSRYSSVS